MKKKKSTLELAVYVIIALLVIYTAAALGTALDMSVTEDGKTDFSQFTANFESSLTQPKFIFSGLKDKKSKTFAFAAFSSVGIVLYVMYKSANKKRLHRKGVEHGSARWATPAEEKSLADKSDNKNYNTTPITGKIFSRKKGQSQQKNKMPYETDNNILLTQEVRMSLNTRQHKLNLNVLIIGGAGAGKSRFFVKPNLMQLNTSYVVTDPSGELLRSCGKLMEDAGYEIRVFNLINMNHSNNYNPFNYVYDRDGKVDSSYVMKMVDCLMKNTKQEGSTGGDQFWGATRSVLKRYGTI